MTTIAITIGWLAPVTVSNDVIELDMWRDTLTGIGRFEFLLNNQGTPPPYANLFLPDMRVSIFINVGAGFVLMMRGYVDDITEVLDKKGVYTNLLKITGRDHGMDLAQLFLTADYQIQPADDIVSAALVAAGSEIVYGSPSLAPQIPYDFDRTFLTDGIREIAETVNYDFYVNNAIPPTLNFFAIGAATDSTVDLISDPNNVNNNILELELGERLGFGIKNHIDVHMGSVSDQWSDENAQPAVPPPYGWIGGEIDGNTATHNIRAPPPLYAPLKGRSVIEWERVTAGGAASVHSMLIDFNAAAPPWTNVSDYYGYAGGEIDLSERNDCSVMVRTDAGGGLVIIRPQLVDNLGNTIWFYAMLGFPVPAQDDDRQGYGPTDDLTADKWYRLKFPVGDDLTIAPALSQQQWSFTIGAAFNWDRVRELWFTGVNNQNPCHYWIDDLTIKGIEARYITTDAASIVSYGIRMQPEHRPDIGNQVEAVYYGESYLEKYKDPLRVITVTAQGETRNVFAGQLVDVRAPSSGLAALTRYRIIKLHHSVKRSPDRNEIAGYDFITEYELVRFQISGVDIPYDAIRIEVNKNPSEGLIQKTKRANRWLANAQGRRRR